MVVLHHPPTGHSTSPSHHPLRAPILSYQTNFHLSLPTHQMSPWKACITSPQATEPSLNTTNSAFLILQRFIILTPSPAPSRLRDLPNTTHTAPLPMHLTSLHSSPTSPPARAPPYPPYTTHTQPLSMHHANLHTPPAPTSPCTTPGQDAGTAVQHTNDPLRPTRPLGSPLLTRRRRHNTPLLSRIVELYFVVVVSCVVKELI